MTYTIKPGDTLISISKQFNVTMLSIIFANNIKDPNMIGIGKQLIIPTETDNPFSLEVVLNRRILKLLTNNKVVKQYSVAIGKPSTPTPQGSWTITGKYLWGGAFGGRFMQLSIPWGTYGIHGTNKPWSIGKNVSHGCIRMYSNQVAELYSIIPKGTPVLIY